MGNSHQFNTARPSPILRAVNECRGEVSQVDHSQRNNNVLQMKERAHELTDKLSAQSHPADSEVIVSLLVFRSEIDNTLGDCEAIAANSANVGVRRISTRLQLDVEPRSTAHQVLVENVRLEHLSTVASN